jgi:hypothetical protein
MTHLELLEMQLRRAEEKRGSAALLTRMIRQKVEEMRQRLSPVPGKPNASELRLSRFLFRNSSLPTYQARLRKGA